MVLCLFRVLCAKIHETSILNCPSCVRMSATSDYLLEPVSCTEKAKFICVKDTCPDGVYKPYSTYENPTKSHKNAYNRITH